MTTPGETSLKKLNLIRVKDTESAIRTKVIDLLSELKDLKFVFRLVKEFKKIEIDYKIKYINFYSNSKVQTIINENDIDD